VSATEHSIRHVTVIGAGVMGGAIAAHLANAGVDVLMLDIATDDPAKPRDHVAREAILRMESANPPPLMRRADSARIQPGNLADDLHRISASDWIIEAVAENLEIKRSVYASLEPHLNDHCAISSNTSTFRLEHLLKNRSDRFKAGFAITHFFNPPRYMRLVEFAAGPQMEGRFASSLQAFCDIRLGKTVVPVKDSPGFIANRIGTYFVDTAINEAIASGASIEVTDAQCGSPLGMPKTGVFGLLDLVGLDVYSKVKASLRAHLPETDELARAVPSDDLLTWMINEGRLGRKSSSGGFYAQLSKDGVKQKLSLDLSARQWRQTVEAKLPRPKDMREFLEAKESTLAKRTILKTLSYAAAVLGEVSDHPEHIDAAMRLGYNWTWGPFETLERLGSGWVAQALEDIRCVVPPAIREAAAREASGDKHAAKRSNVDPSLTRPVSLEAFKATSKQLVSGPGANLWDTGSGIAVFEITTKANALSRAVFDRLNQSLDLLEEGRGPCQAMVIYSDGSNFAAGADLREFASLIAEARWEELREFAAYGQASLQRLRRCKIPVVAAVKGAALGGGCELLLHSTAVQAHAESRIGLVESTVGIVPAWGGCADMLRRYQLREGSAKGPYAVPEAVHRLIGRGRTSSSVYDAIELGFLRASDGISMNIDRVFEDAMNRARSLIGATIAVEPVGLVLGGVSAATTLNAGIQAGVEGGMLTAHDQVVASELATVLTGGDCEASVPTDAARVLTLEVEAAMRLFKMPATQARIRSLLDTGKPLRN
jgi:3-hydroxyacyl-CoA dehydrogenase